MIESLLQQAKPTADQGAAVRSAGRVTFDGRHPKLLDHRDHVLRVTAGHLDIFAVGTDESGAGGPRHPLFRVESNELLLDLQSGFSSSDLPIQVLAVGSAGAEAFLVPRTDIQSSDLLVPWIRRLAGLTTGENPSWDMLEVASNGDAAIAPGDRRRGPARSIAWVSLEAGTARQMGLGPAIAAGAPPLPLTSGMWIEAGPAGCSAIGSEAAPDMGTLWRAIDQFHLGVAVCVNDRINRNAGNEARRLVQRSELMAAQTAAAFDRLSEVIVQRSSLVDMAPDSADPLSAACRMVAEAVRSPLAISARPAAAGNGFAEVVEIARTARLRVRRTLLRGEWWEQDVGPLVAWHGETRTPVALIRRGNRHYVMFDTRTGTRRRVDRSVAMELAPEAASFYPTLPTRPLRFRDLLAFSFRHSAGNFGRVVFAILVIGLLSLVTPLIVNVLIDSVIPRSELDQLVFCALALAVTAIATAGMQTMQGLAMLRVEGLMDWKLQAAVIDRVLRLPTSLFRAYTVGDFVDRSMGIDAARRVFTGHALRSMTVGLFAWFSIGLMLYYDVKLGMIAVALTLARALLIVAVSAVRLHHENRYFALQGKIGGFLLQVITGIGKLRLADATSRALSAWSTQFTAQKRNFIASQKASNILTVFESAYPLVATLVIFAAATFLKSKLTQDVGSFLAFFAAFGQSMSSIGALASGISAALIAIPRIARLRPLISSAAELSEGRTSPGELSGTVELSRVTFRYASSGPPVLEDVSLRIAAGEYVAIVGPSGSGKSSLFRLLLGFEKPQAGTVFFDGKAIDTLDVSAVRRQLGVVMQNAKLATGSIYDNICGGIQLPLEQVWEAARLAGLDDDIRAMPMGMNTVVAEGVNTLSGGQQQRIMIARAVARRPRILLLDEATSALDNRSQAIVSTSLGNLNVTRIVIAHRLSTVRQADRIVVLVDGKVAQTGSYAELSNAPGTFASFAQRQLL